MAVIYPRLVNERYRPSQVLTLARSGADALYDRIEDWADGVRRRL